MGKTKDDVASANGDVISILNGLVETCRDGQEGYNAAANAIKNTDLKKLFKTYSRQRGQFVGELQAEVARLGGTPEKSGSISGAVHRGWIDLKAAAATTGDPEAAVIAECERGEASAVKKYDDAMASDLPAELRTLIKHQYIQVKESYDLVRALEKATK